VCRPSETSPLFSLSRSKFYTHIRFCSMCAKCPNHLVLIYWAILTCGADCNLWCSSSCRFL
jgi:hypothetical protein